ncbi:hypothetical protein MUK42_15458 [Musa troglodytarum]|uniref:Extracellular ligand-gated ion channel n=1 Tax=Musa troglodytarum TaxID=320322 RepID=A0A9E7H277_9LILI|nr:hypothetical protein MUK42_15458 [Musa troglodytarum]
MTGGDVVVEAITSSSIEPLMPSKVSYARNLSRADDELKFFRSCLRWMCIDQSNTRHAMVSWSLFLLLGVFVPIASHFVLSCAPTRRTYDAVVQLSLTSASSLSYLCLSAFVRRYGLRRFLFLDKLVGESERVREGYMDQLNRSFRLLSIFVMPCFVGEVAYKIWWYSSGSERIPFAMTDSIVIGDVVACILELASWIYRMSLFLLVCVLFRLMCHLQILRLQDFASVFGEGGPESDVASVLGEHLRIRRQLRIISHRYRSFILSCLLLVTASQLATLLLTTRPRAVVNLNNAGELALCSIGLVTGLLICLRSAAKITHKAQAITSQAATWHACATIESFDAESETSFPPNCSSGDESDDADDKDGDVLDVRKMMPSKINTISFQKRQALVTYLENNRAGITVFGFVVDRAWLHALFMIEFSLVMWLLGKTVGIS